MLLNVCGKLYVCLLHLVYYSVQPDVGLVIPIITASKSYDQILRVGVVAFKCQIHCMHWTKRCTTEVVEFLSALRQPTVDNFDDNFV